MGMKSIVVVLGLIVACTIAIVIFVNFTSSRNIDKTSSNATCNIPQTLTWVNKEYVLESKNTDLEPGMKFGYLECKNGQLVVGDDTYNAITVYSVGNPSINKGIILIGTWGRVLYLPKE
ncbi:hypothetical protein PASE110613_07075 [Paenibacillus sediminis]|uniref:Uncharacterized protein n=1 Tax=Paenibacillus sediminis TaxID=664909 RepID=A0ABS4H1Z3_9BACL|nr:hypothetical protein [Paenibacillus sediminis]MBP1936549.1 hypothetical protein [Paenibacillus sediminis]